MFRDLASVSLMSANAIVSVLAVRYGLPIFCFLAWHSALDGYTF
jgi:hypothetical protein